MKLNDMIEAIQFGVNRFAEGEASDYIKELETGEASTDVIGIALGIYFAIDSLSNSFIAYFGDEKVSEMLGLSQLSERLSNALAGKKSSL